MRMLPSSAACATRPATDHRAARSIVTRLAGQTRVGPPMQTPRSSPRAKELVESAMSCCCLRSAHWSCRRPMQAWVISVATPPPAPPPRRPPHLSLLISLSRSRSPRLSSTSSLRAFHAIENELLTSQGHIRGAVYSMWERNERTVPGKRHRGEPGHTHGTRGRTRAHGSHQRTSQPSKPTYTQPARQRDDRSRGRLNSAMQQRQQPQARPLRPGADPSPRPTQKRPPPANPTLPPPAPRAPPRACSKAVGEMKARAAVQYR